MPDNYVSKFNINDKELIVKDSEARNNANTASTNATNALNRVTEYKELLLYKTNELNRRISTIIADGQQTEGNTELIDIRTGADGKVYPTAGDAVRVQIGALSEGNAKLKEDLEDNYELLSTGETTLDMKWVQGYWYDINNGGFGAASPGKNYVASKHELVGDGSTLVATKTGGLGLSLFVCEYSLDNTFIKGYQYGNTILNITLDRDKKYRFSIT